MNCMYFGILLLVNLHQNRGQDNSVFISNCKTELVREVYELSWDSVVYVVEYAEKWKSKTKKTGTWFFKNQDLYIVSVNDEKLTYKRDSIDEIIFFILLEDYKEWNDVKPSIEKNIIDDEMVMMFTEMVTNDSSNRNNNLLTQAKYEIAEDKVCGSNFLLMMPKYIQELHGLRTRKKPKKKK